MSRLKPRLTCIATVYVLLCMLNVAKAQQQLGDPGGDPDPNTVTTWYRDFDGDGFGDPNKMVSGPVQPAGYVANNLDCNDYQTVYEDKDNDGWGSALKIPCGWIVRTGDCNDNDRTIHSLQTFYRDADGDSYGDAGNKIMLCTNTPPAGYIRNSIDCNDNDPKVYWPKKYYRDADGDGLGDPNNFINVCSSTPPAGYVTNSRDTNDKPPPITTKSAVNPGTTSQLADGDAVSRFSLAASPNPFRQQTQIQYTVSAPAKLSIKVYDITGREVGTVFTGDRAIGVYLLELNSPKFSAGVYYLRMNATTKDGKNIMQTQKLVKTD